jgi:hypothetical protein
MFPLPLLLLASASLSTAGLLRREASPTFTHWSCIVFRICSEHESDAPLSPRWIDTWWRNRQGIELASNHYSSDYDYSDSGSPDYYSGVEAPSYTESYSQDPQNKCPNKRCDPILDGRDFYVKPCLHTAIDKSVTRSEVLEQCFLEDTASVSSF